MDVYLQFHGDKSFQRYDLWQTLHSLSIYIKRHGLISGGTNISGQWEQQIETGQT